MTRTARRKMGYAFLVVVGSVALGAGLREYDVSWNWLVIVALLFLVPSRIQGYFWRPFFRGRRLAAAGDNELALQQFNDFLALLEQHPWRRHFIWFNGSIYTNSAHTMALNNIGASCLELGRFDTAEKALRAASLKDPSAPLPHYNLALVAEARGESQAAARHLATARDLGYAAATPDRLVSQLSLLLARIEGRGGDRCNMRRSTSA